MSDYSFPDVFILIPVHNRRETTVACLEKLQTTGDLERFQIVVIDDGSTDGTGEAIAQNYPQVNVLQGDGNLWWTGAIKKGMKYAYERNADFVIWLNDDCEFSEQTITNLVGFCYQNSESVIGCEVRDKQSGLFVSYGGQQKTWKGFRLIQTSPGQITHCDALCGNIVCIPRKLIDVIGYPNAKALPHYGGDTLYTIKARKSGFSIFVDNRTLVLNTMDKEPKLYPRNWLLAPGSPLRLLELTFMRQSGLSWHVWLRINWEGYHIWGLVMLSKKYTSILLLTLLRFLPYAVRVRLSNFMKK
ncbi:MAG: glycosyltransferase family 2 protein [Leptolyngbya sp. SIOISBB]|nr:glycosyltransferase family 2 protein [Leptolyngbya sp. SIOISBB]